MSELTVGKLRSIMSRLDDSCPVELNVGKVGFNCEQIEAELDSDGEAGWLSISVKSEEEHWLFPDSETNGKEKYQIVQFSDGPVRFVRAHNPTFFEVIGEKSIATVSKTLDRLFNRNRN